MPGKGSKAPGVKASTIQNQKTRLTHRINQSAQYHAILNLLQQGCIAYLLFILSSV